MKPRHAIISGFAAFLADEEGAATVDFVVGTAMAVSLGLAVMNAVSDGTMILSDRIAAKIAGIEFSWTADPTTTD